MALNWQDKVDGTDTIYAKDINSLAHAITDLEQSGGGKGEKGDDGASAYDIWLSEGNVGTESDFIASLKGEKGEKGEKGDTGDKGADGAPGEAGEKGESGVNGKDGEDGESGLMKVITVSNPQSGYTLYNNCEYHIDFTDSLVLEIDLTHESDGSESDASRSKQCSVMFTVPSGFTSVAFPTDVIWAVATPVFTAGSTYIISFIPNISSGYIAIWTVIA